MEIKVLASGSAGNCYMVSDGTTPVLLECGIRFRDIQRGLGFGITALAGCLVSHEHQDHARSAGEIMRYGVEVYASRGTIEAAGMTGHRVNPITALTQFTIGTWSILPFDTVHDAVEPLGFVLASSAGKVLYLTDSAHCRYRFNGLTHLLVEANHSVEILRRNVDAGMFAPEHFGRVIRNHLSIERLIDMLRANDLSQVREIYLLHLSDQNSDEEAFKLAVLRATGKPVYVC